MDGQGLGLPGVFQVSQPLPDRVGIEFQLGGDLLRAEAATLAQDGMDGHALPGGELAHPGCGFMRRARVVAPRVTARIEVDRKLGVGEAHYFLKRRINRLFGAAQSQDFLRPDGSSYPSTPRR